MSAKESEASRLLRAAARKLLGLEFEASVLFYKTNQHSKIGSDAGFAIMDIIAAYGAHIGWERPARVDIGTNQKSYGPRVLAILTKLSSDLEAIEFADYPGGPSKARRDGMRGRILILCNEGDAASVDEIRRTLAESKAFDWTKEPHTVLRLRELEARQAGKP
jgi:hypothetical protein